MGDLIEPGKLVHRGARLINLMARFSGIMNPLADSLPIRLFLVRPHEIAYQECHHLSALLRPQPLLLLSYSASYRE